MKRILALVLAVLLLAGCSAQDAPDVTQATVDTAPATTAAEPGTSVGVCLPDGEDERWLEAGAALEQKLKALGWDVTMQYAENDARQQKAQIQQLLDFGVDCLVIAAVDSVELTEVSIAAGEQNVPIIAFDRMLMDTEAVSWYVSYDYVKMGRSVGTYIVEELGLADVTEPYTIEFFMGSPEDNNALLFHKGVMEVLEAYLSSGVLVCKTGRTAFEDTCILSWDEDTARTVCGSYLTDYYGEEALDICVAASDILARGCADALAAADYGEDNWPLITGQDVQAATAGEVKSGRVQVSVYKDTEVLVQACADMVDAVMSGREPEVNDTENCSNNARVVPAYLCSYSLVDAEGLPKDLAQDAQLEETQPEETTEQTTVESTAAAS